MSTPVEHIVIVGGGTAGWLSACVLGARLRGKRITLVEAPDIPTIGVGEGTWPTMRETLATIGIPEAEFLVACNAAFKQGSRFDGWRDGWADDSYLHPFTAPPAADMRDLAAAWQTCGQQGSFAAAITPQHAVCAANLAPRQRAMPDYAGALNYGYHLDAGKFAALLMRHATQRLGVTRIAAQVTGVSRAANGDIAALLLQGGATLEGDLFLDCSGQAAILIAGECGAEWVDRSDVSFNDRALAVQVPVEPGSPIAAQTIGTAHEAGWIWDIGLPTRRGIGCVYASRFISDDRAAEILRAYIAAKVPGSDPASLTPRKLAFRTGHRDRFWIGNCLAVGLSAGFIEPLEASAIVLIELSLKALADNFPQSRASMDIHASRFNELFRYRWDRVVEFLKLHYVPSQRTEPYWQAQRAPETIPPRLAECLALWREQAPSAWDFPRIDEMFPAASQQYVLHGMGVPVPLASTTPAAPARLAEIAAKARALAAALPTTRDYLDLLAAGSAAARIPA
ncbi:tryptophan halogenase family protein [Novosphingobium sp.]|uniref:tryptophan halogenase family protein n=1 Tax=Novosphingobium sp. TaxID=1874826 RepID=UPI00260B8CB2|nr:tryptophan halogenase family protein [Novosphingobium sp.]